MTPHTTVAEPGLGAEEHAVGAIVLGGAHGSLAIARSLGRRGIPVCFITNDHPLARFSHYVEDNFSWSGADDPRAFDELMRLAHQNGWDGWVLFPGGDAEVRFVAQNHAALAAVFRVMTPAWETVRFAYDKHLMYQRAQSLGIAIPRTYRAENLQQLMSMAPPLPVILKPTAHAGSNAFTAAKAWRADDPATLRARYQHAAELVGEQSIVVQELIPGNGAAQFSFAAVCQDGTPLGFLVARRGRQYPVDFGFTSTYVETVDQPEVEEAARRFLASLRYTGLVEIEFKFDVRESRYKILDVNARSWTWSALGQAAGVDFPYLLWRLALSEAVAETRGRTGVAWVHLARDAVAGVQEMLAGTLRPKDYVRSLGRCRVFASFAKDDPLPGLVELPLVLSRVLSRRLRPKLLAYAGAGHRPRVA